jgi:hypothetical protein
VEMPYLKDRAKHDTFPCFAGNSRIKKLSKTLIIQVQLAS